MVKNSPNEDDDELNFEPTHTWLYAFKEKYLWPKDLYTNLVAGMPSPSGSSLSSVEDFPMPDPAPSVDDLPVLNPATSSSSPSITMEDIQVALLSPGSSTSSDEQEINRVHVMRFTSLNQNSEKSIE